PSRRAGTRHPDRGTPIPPVRRSACSGHHPRRVQRVPRARRPGLARRGRAPHRATRPCLPDPSRLGGLMRTRMLLITTTAAVSLALTAAPVGASSPHVKGNGETIRLVTHDSFAVSQDVLDAFTARTGIKVEILHGGDAGAVVNQAILTKDNPVGDVLF